MELPPLPKARQRWIRHLHSKRHRDSERCFIAEGVRTLEELQRSRFQAVLLATTPEAARQHRPLIEHFLQQQVPCYTTDADTFARLAQTTSPQGVLAVVAYPDNAPTLPTGSLLALDAINDPGNAGTIVRTAHWFGYSGIVFGDGCVDRFHPKFVRATMGALFHIALIEASLESLLDRLRHTHCIVGTTVGGGQPLARYRLRRQPHVLVVGSEAHGLSPGVRSVLTDCVTIEGSGSFDSLNAAVAAAIVMYHLFQNP